MRPGLHPSNRRLCKAHVFDDDVSQHNVGARFSKQINTEYLYGTNNNKFRNQSNWVDK